MTPITRKGYEQLKKELERLKKVDRAQVIQDLIEARAHGDLSENAEYAAAKERQAFVEGKIQEMEGKLATVQIIDTTKLKTDKVVFGCTVLLKDRTAKREIRYTLVGQEEADGAMGKISVLSPVGKGLIGHKKGDVVKITTPVKVLTYEVLNIMVEEEGHD